MKHRKIHGMIKWTTTFTLACFSLVLTNQTQISANNMLGGPTHIGTFEGSTTFTTSSSNGINPGLYLEVMDRYGNYKTYTSEDGVITVDGTKEGAYVTQAKLLGKTKYRDVQTGELLDQWEDGRDLKLESVKMPVLTTTGKNVFNPNWLINENTKHGVSVVDGDVVLNGEFTDPVTWFEFKIPKGTYKATNFNTTDTSVHVFWMGTDGYFTHDKPFTYDTETTVKGYIAKGVYVNHVLKLQVESGTDQSTYEPFKSNILTVNEPIELRGIGDARDELDLLTGEVVERIGEISLDGNENWRLSTQSDDYADFRIMLDESLKSYTGAGGLCDKLKYQSNKYGSWIITDEGITVFNNQVILSVLKTRLQSADVSGFKTWLSQNPITVQYGLAIESIKTVDLTSTYTFGTVAMRDVYVDGKVKPLLCSVNVPTENLTFVLDPNQEEEKQFIAPTFRLINETPTSVRVSLTAFKQESNVFNDVSPTKYENWSQLNKEQSKDIALALVPLASDNWVTVDETPRYVNNYSASVLGEIKAKSSVDLTFKALHGQAFTEELNPQYRLVFLFDF